MEFGATFWEGVATVFAAVVVFCGSVFLLLALLLGARLAYFITASVTLAFLLIMGLIWSTGSVPPLGPVGELPKWDVIDIAEEGDAPDVPSGQAYPEAPWEPVNEEDAAQQTQASELGSDAVDAVNDAAETGELEPREAAGNLASTETIRFLQEDGTQYGLVLIEPPQGEENVPNFLVAMRYDPGNPFKDARFVTAGTFVLLVLHLGLLNQSEKRARRRKEEASTP